LQPQEDNGSDSPARWRLDLILRDDGRPLADTGVRGLDGQQNFLKIVKACASALVTARD
jgi:hypothetical protein